MPHSRDLRLVLVRGKEEATEIHSNVPFCHDFEANKQGKRPLMDAPPNKNVALSIEVNRLDTTTYSKQTLPVLVTMKKSTNLLRSSNPSCSTSKKLDCSIVSTRRVVPQSNKAARTKLTDMARHFIQSGIPEYIGGESLGKASLTETCNTTTVADRPTNHGNPEEVHHDDPLVSYNNGCIVRHGSQQQSSLHESINTGNDRSENNWIWKIEAPLPSVPQHAPLERAALHIKDIPLDTITSRISNFLRINSISTYYSTQETGRVDCHTSSCIKFVVQLWNDQESNDAIIVEVQRRRGCSIQMRCLRNSLYKCIRSGDDPCRYIHQIQLRRLSKGLEKKICDQLYPDPSGMANHQINSKKRRLLHCQEACLDLMESDKVDENRLGIECFLGMTDPKSDEPCYDIARALIFNEGHNAIRLRQSFLRFLCNNRSLVGTPRDEPCYVPFLRPRGFSDHADVFQLDSEPEESPELDETHVLALTALVNTLESIDSHERDYLTNEATTKLHLSTSFWTQVLEVLVNNMYDSSKRPLEAALSAKALRILENLRPESLSPIICSFLVPILKRAHQIGKDRHWSLEKEAAELCFRYCDGQME